MLVCVCNSSGELGCSLGSLFSHCFFFLLFFFFFLSPPTATATAAITTTSFLSSSVSSSSPLTSTLLLFSPHKTVPDLISSFADGRLWKQCQNMEKHYTVPVLLIEFRCVMFSPSDRFCFFGVLLCFPERKRRFGFFGCSKASISALRSLVV